MVADARRARDAALSTSAVAETTLNTDAAGAQGCSASSAGPSRGSAAERPTIASTRPSGMESTTAPAYGIANARRTSSVPLHAWIERQLGAATVGGRRRSGVLEPDRIGARARGVPLCAGTDSKRSRETAADLVGSTEHGDKVIHVGVCVKLCTGLYEGPDLTYPARPKTVARHPRDPNDTSDSDHVRAKTVVTSISRISDRPTGKEACLVVIYGSELGKKYNLNAASLVIGRSSKCDIQIDQESISRNHRRSSTRASRSSSAISARRTAPTSTTSPREYVLRDGDLIKIGRTIFKFLTGGNIETPTTKRSIASPPSTGSRRSTTSATSSKRSSARSRARSLPSSPVAVDVRHRSLQEHQRQTRPPRRRLRAHAPRDGGARQDPSRRRVRAVRAATRWVPERSFFSFRYSVTMWRPT